MTQSLPQSIESERIVLGAAMLTGGDALAECQHLGLRAEDFFREAHQRLYTHFLWRRRQRRLIEMVAVIEDLAQQPPHTIHQLGGLSYISQLADDVPSTENVAHYARILIERAARRRIIDHCTGLAQRARFGDVDLSVVLPGFLDK